MNASHAPVRIAARYDAVVVGGGHNGLTAAAYLARAGRSVLVLERLDHVGGAAVSAPVFDGVDARLSRYSYLVSLMPRQVVDELGLRLTLRRRRFSSYTPVGDGGLLVDNGSDDATRASFETLGAGRDHEAWQAFSARVGRLAQRLFPTVTAPLVSREEARALVDDDETWRAVVEQPLGETLRATFASDVVRGVAATDGLIGTFADLDDTALLQNRCYLYHVIGGGTGDWDVPVGGMGAVSGALHDAARAAGATVVTGAQVTAVDPGTARSDAEVSWTDADGGTHAVRAGAVVSGAAPSTLDTLLAAAGGSPSGRETAQAPEGAQLKVNMLLRRLPRLREGIDPVAAFSGTFHVNESYSQLQAAHAQAAAGQVPDLPPCEIYCHSLTDDSILGPDLRAAGAQTLTLFGLHMPARLFRDDPDGARERALAATLRSLDSVLAEPIQDILWRGPDGAPCLEARSPVDLEGSVGLPGGHIFHRDLSWPWAEPGTAEAGPATGLDAPGTWGVETLHPRVLVAGAGARRGGGVSGIPGRSAAMALLAG
ncbi:NAD(P)/FAD-dependent oxidoreductase [Isoptericola halotolerans]|uniref:Phytoene dehydrogenase-like protein n=1 Tax=Isoptericola halotolerans TaxID=300560 RepID=A0ABX2A7Z2_9MICO|nr:NAD(P)/FAD-dependent oxidoreductase [Isoptericola halotolerans]NOV98918.1 phytoene dehydrogenase-like protein [Isoptericola halotolerans]